jgi:hypothetical protein
VTPPRLIELQCPQCDTKHWEIDSDYRGMDGIFIEYSEREYDCQKCGYSKNGYTVLRKSPPEFILQPHPMYPMRQQEFDYWAAILKTNFPDHPMVEKLEKDFRPNTQVLLTKLRNKSYQWKNHISRKIIFLKVDIEEAWHRIRKIMKH